MRKTSSRILQIVVTTTAIFWSLYSQAIESTDYAYFDGMDIFAQDISQQYLGHITTNIYDSESIINEYGSYGSSYSTTSIRNEYSQYGSAYGVYSAYNEYTTTPPIIYSWNGSDYVAEAYLTKNHYLSGTTVDPDGLISYLLNPSTHPPQADAGPDQTVDEEVTVTLDGSNSSDIDDGIASYLWEQTNGLSVTLSSTEVAKPTFTAPNVSSDEESLTFLLTVTDNGGLQSTDSCNITIINNDSGEDDDDDDDNNGGGGTNVSDDNDDGGDGGGGCFISTAIN